MNLRDNAVPQQVIAPRFLAYTHPFFYQYFQCLSELPSVNHSSVEPVVWNEVDQAFEPDDARN